ncbi:unnamed protein product [Durusdinium trenchii]|uniref:protein-tyrosine-phosphatase n=2 Tax=Durusdinium trenchii TaxID=1381693 RepID=A0ABP0Q488_9DINO
MSGGRSLWRSFAEERLLWVAGGDGLEANALVVAGERRISCSQVLCLEQLDISANLKLQLPFFANELLGAVHLHGPLGLDTILDFCHHLQAVLEEVEKHQSVCLTCSRRPGAVANSLLLLGAFLILERGYTADKVMRLVDSSNGGAIPTSELRFPTPFLEQPNFTEDSLMLSDCFVGFEMAISKKWLDKQAIEERRQVAMAFDAVPVFSVVLQGQPNEKLAAVHFWIAADPVTTVEDPSDREQDLLNVDANDQLAELAWSPTSPPAHSHFSRAVSEPSGDLTPSHLATAVRIFKSHDHLHTLDEEGKVGESPKHVWAHHAHVFPALSMPSSRVNTKLPTKVHTVTKDQLLKRPANLPIFASFLKQKVRCTLLARANFPTERGMPDTGSYDSFFERWGINQLDVPFADGTAPPKKLVSQLISSVEQLLKGIALTDGPEDTGERCKPECDVVSVVVHCKSGLGRSMALLAALAIAFCPGLTAGAFFGWARLVRPACLQTPMQERFLRSLDETPDCNCFFACFKSKKVTSPTVISGGSHGTTDTTISV